MAIQTGVNSTSPNTIRWATAGTDPYVRVSQLAGPVENFDLHDHSSGKNLAVARVAATTDIVGTMTSATAVTIGRQGATNPALQVDTSGATATTGVKVTANVATAGATIAAISSGSNEPLNIDAKGSGAVVIGGGSSGNVVIGNSVSGVVILNRVSEARVFHSANQSIANTTLTALAFDSERYDTDTIHDTVTNNSRLTCQNAGKYLITGCVAWASGAGNYRDVFIRLNGTTNLLVDVSPPVGGGFTTVQNVSTVYALAGNDYVELLVQQDSGGALNVTANGNYSPEFSMTRIG